MIVTLNWRNTNVIPEKLKNILKQNQFVFNPSYLLFNDFNYLVVRVYDVKTESIKSILYIWNNTHEINEIDLSSFFNEKLNISKVADTKLFIMNNAIWGTFNSGYEEKENNKLVIFKINKLHIANYYLCEYENRARVEKNWAFYYHENEMYALYSINKLKVLKVSSIKENKIIFDDYFNANTVNYGGYTIGTPLAKYKGNYIFIAHRKIVRNGKRLYLGRPFLFNPLVKPQVIPSKKYMIHSIRALFGTKHKFNKSLMSCTYFSGIYISKNNILISYGVNDVSWRICKIKLKSIGEFI